MTSVNVPVDPPITRLPLSTEQASWYARILAEVSRARLSEIVAEMTSIASPTGEERALAERLTARGRRAGLEATCQVIEAGQANALLRHPGRGDGPDLLLYAPIDTHTVGTEADDLPWVGSSLREDMVPRASVHGDYVVGLGANNPKGHAACILAAVEATCRAGAPLRGAVLAGFGSGGMPVNPRPGAAQRDVGHGRGCAFMLEHGFRGDFAVIAKTGWAVAWEEVGLAWIRVRVHGALNYAGIRHFVRYENPIVRAATVIGELEHWFAEYTKANTSGLVAPQGSLGAVEGGWTYKPTFVPAACDLYLDLRISPRTSVPDVRRQFEDAMTELRRRHPEIPLTWEMLVAVPGTHTHPESWIVQSCMRGWEDVEGRPHVPRTNQSGATDANILRGHGVPTARVGMARVPDDAPMPDDFSKGMNVVSLREMERLTRCLVYVIVDTCLRSRDEVGLGPK
jgi:acetylornithine deacetylase/succinyl-diaminopimelate desuccinylase-like protein